MCNDYDAFVSCDWTKDERDQIVTGINAHGLDTGRCAALARVVHAVGKPKDPETQGVQLNPMHGARFLVPKKPHIPQWRSHTYVETQRHAVDAVTGADGYAADGYVGDHWEWPDCIEARKVDVATVDPGIEDDR